ncbi:MAG: 30S ribosomal protein S16 [Planctomycetes bacterium]|nr:30S ribosomal protein S16 [Planctomycetota bacterium]
MSVRIRMKKLGRKHRPYFRICAIDIRSPRDGRVIEELGTYDPLIPETDARVRMDHERVQYWLGVGAQPSDRVRILIKKYGPQGTHLAAQQAATEKLATPKMVAEVGTPAYVRPEKPKKGEKPAPETAAATEAAPAPEPEVAAEPAPEATPEPAAEATE